MSWKFSTEITQLSAFCHFSIIWLYEKWLLFRLIIWLLHSYVLSATHIIIYHPLLDCCMWLICTRLKLNLYMSFFYQSFRSIVIDFAKMNSPITGVQQNFVSFQSLKDYVYIFTVAARIIFLIKLQVWGMQLY